MIDKPMDTGDRTLQNIYFQYMRGELRLEEAARQVCDFALKQKVRIGFLELDALLEEERSKVAEVLDYILQPIQQQYFKKELSPTEAAARMAPILLPHGSWGLTFNSVGLSESAQQDLNEMLTTLMRAIAELESVYIKSK